MQTFIRKITSRKFIVAVVGIIVGLAAAFGIEENEYAQMVGLIGSIVSAISYIIGEAKVDAAGAQKNTEAIKETAKETAGVLVDALNDALNNPESPESSIGEDQD